MITTVTGASHVASAKAAPTARSGADGDDGSGGESGDNDDAIAAQIADCMGREDPVCLAEVVASLELASHGGVTTAWMAAWRDLLVGDYAAAAATLDRVATSPLTPAPLALRAAKERDLARATESRLRGFTSRDLAGGRARVWFAPGPDEVLIEGLEEVLGRTLPVLEATFGPLGPSPIAIHIYRRAEDLAAVSGLTVDQIHTSGTIALCKYNRVMITSPADLVFGYAWADTVAHELVHYAVIKRGGGGVPVWLHEGLARAFQGAWRGERPDTLDPNEEDALGRAHRKHHFIPFSRMSPTMAALPSQSDAQLAFAEVHHAVAWLLRRSGGGEQANTPATARAAVSLEDLQRAAGRLVLAFGEGLTESAVIERLVGLSRARFSRAWRQDLQRVAAQSSRRDAGVGTHRTMRFRGASKEAAVFETLGERPRQFVELGDRLMALDRPLAASIEYRKALAGGAAREPLLMSRLGRALIALGKYAEALTLVREGLAVSDEHAPLRLLEGRALVELGRHREALDALRRAGWINPFDPDVHLLAQRAWMALGENPKAEAAAARARMVSGAETPPR